MASSSKNPEQPDTIEEINNHLTNFGRQVETNKKALWVAMVAILVVACMTFGWLYLIRIPNANKANEAYNKVELNAFGNDSLAAAQYKKVADEYGSYDAGKLAALSAAQSLYTQGKYEEAAKYLDKFSSKDKVLDANAEILLGDCYVNLKKYDNAISAFKKAESKGKGNPQIAPRALLKQAVVYDEQKKYSEALKCYETIKKEYPEFQFGNGMSIDSYIEREKARI